MTETNPIKKARLIKGATQEEIANELGVSTVTVCKWEQGKSFPKVKRLKAVADALDTTVSALLNGDGREVI